MNARPVLCVRYSPDEYARLEAAASIMGSASLGRFVRSASLTLAGAIEQAAAEIDLEPGERITCWISDTSLEELT